MSQRLRVLILEDRPADAELMLHELRRAGLDPEWRRVDTEAGFREEIQKPTDLIFADYHLPGFDGMRALEIVQQSGIDVPLIIVSGGIGEDVAVQAMQAGAADYLIKDRLQRLGSAVQRALERKSLRDQRVESDRARREADLRFRRVFEEGAVGIAIITPDFRAVDVNDSLCRMLRRSREELLSMSFLDYTHPEDREFEESISAQLITGQIDTFELEKRYITPDGTVVWGHVSASTVRGEDGTVIFGVAVVQDITERKRAESELKYLALHDALTGLPNRTLFSDRLEQAILAARRDRKQLALLVMDLDRFKDVNDSLGHASGDLLLQEVAARLNGTLRGTDTVARLGGDEFAIVPAGQAGLASAVIASQKILRAMEQPTMLGHASIDLSASIGVALFPDHGEDVSSLMRHADVAMYVAKRAKSGYAIYSPEQDEHSALQLSLMGELRSTIRLGGLVLHYQPEIDVKTGLVSSLEALVRWQHPQHGLLPPDQFIPSAEQTDMMGPLTRWVIDDSLRQLSAWREAGHDFAISVNLSAGNLHDSNLADQTARVLARWKIPPDRLTVEITESAIMAAPAVKTLTALSELGIHVSIDDFGTGYSSLAYLKNLPVDQIKIDKSFVINMATNSDDAGIVRPTIDLGHNLGIQVVAEGVEDAGSLELLRDFGCDFAQGFHISRPLPAVEMDAWLKRLSNGSQASGAM